MYEMKNFTRCRELYTTLAQSHPSIGWAQCRLAYLDALPFVQLRVHSPLVTVDGKYLSPEAPEPVMFKAITGKNVLLAHAETSKQLQALHRLFAIESAPLVVPFDEAMSRQHETDESHKTDRHLYDVRACCR